MMDSTLTPIPISTQPQLTSVKHPAHKLPIKRKNPSSVNNNPDQPPFKYHRIWTEPDETRFLQGLLDSFSDHLSFPRDLHVFYARFSLTMSQPYTRSQLSEKLRRLRKKFRVISARLARGVEFDSLSGHDRALFGLSRRLWGPEFQKLSPFYGKGVSDDGQGKKRVGVSPTFPINLSSLDCIDSVIEPIFDNEIKIDDDENGNDNDVVNEDYKKRVEISPTLPVNLSTLDRIDSMIEPVLGNDNDNENENVNDDEDNVFVNENNAIVNEENGMEVDGNGDYSEMKQVKIDYDFGERPEVVLRESISCVDGCVSVVGNIVINVFDEVLKEVRAELLSDGLVLKENASPLKEGSSSKGKAVDFAKRWQEQRATELDVLARRMRLVIENSLHG